jgi:hypothetical protein
MGAQLVSTGARQPRFGDIRRGLGTFVVSPNVPPDSPHQSVVPKSLLKCSNASVERMKTFGSGGHRLLPQAGIALH